MMTLKCDTVGQHLLKIKSIMNLTDNDLLEIHQFLFNHRDDEELLSSVLKSNMSEKQKIFLSYIKGIGQEYRSEVARDTKTDKKRYLDQIDAFENISSGFNGWDIVEIARTLSSVLRAMMIETLDKKGVSNLAMQISDDFCRFSDDHKKFKDMSDIMKDKGKL